MIELIKVATVGYISQKALRCFAKKDYADVIAFCTWCAVGIELYNIIITVYIAITKSEIFSLLQFLFRLG